MSATDSIKAKFDEYEYVIKLLTAKVEELAAENERLRGSDAHSTLRLIYSDPDAPRSDRIKAASASLVHEKPKLMSVPPPLDLKAEPQESLQDRHERRLERDKRFEAMTLEEYSALIPGVSGRNGGSDGNGSSGDDTGGNGSDTAG